MFLSDLSTGALVSRYGGIDWLCFPRFDSEAVFASLLGTEEHCRWLLAPAELNDPGVPTWKWSVLSSASSQRHWGQCSCASGTEDPSSLWRGITLGKPRS